MNNRSVSRIIGAAVFGSMLGFGVAYTSIADAAQGCGHGYHMNPNGRCVPNNPGPNSTPVPGRPDCWRNGSGQLRCY